MTITANSHWRDYAACREAPDPNIFFPTRGRPRYDGKTNPREYCQRCPVIRQCLEYALALPWTQSGIYANTNERQRRVLRRQRNAQAS